MRQLKLIIAALFLAVSFTAHADPIKFSWTNNGSTAVLLSGEGYFIIDDGDIVAGLKDYQALISAFEFNWVTTAGNFSSSSANGDQVAVSDSTGFAANMIFNSSLELTVFNLCFSSDGACVARTSHPLLRLTSSLWGATSGSNMPNFVFKPQTITAESVSVPEPGTLALLGIGLLGMGLSRRRKV